jgi:hypothetical protein
LEFVAGGLDDFEFKLPGGEVTGTFGEHHV